MRVIRALNFSILGSGCEGPGKCLRLLADLFQHAGYEESVYPDGWVEIYVRNSRIVIRVRKIYEQPYPFIVVMSSTCLVALLVLGGVVSKGALKG